ncbi:MAG: hypothetical protein ACRDSR_08360 [Pseudonocardiaceae bacterium]
MDDQFGTHTPTSSDSIPIASPSHARDAILCRISDPGCFSPRNLDYLLADLTFEIALGRNLVPPRPGRRYKEKPNEPMAGTKPAHQASQRG